MIIKPDGEVIINH